MTENGGMVDFVPSAHASSADPAEFPFTSDHILLMRNIGEIGRLFGPAPMQ